MKQIFIKKGKALIKEVPRPLLDDYSVLVEVTHSCLSSGTERSIVSSTETKKVIQRALSQGGKHIKTVVNILAEHGVIAAYDAVNSKIDQFVEIGYSCAGRVVAIGSHVEGVKVGDAVSCAGAGFASHGQYVAVPENLVVRVEQDLDLSAASTVTLGAIALHGVRQASLELGETVIVMGLGVLGLLTVQLARIAGCNVIGIDVVQERLDRAKEYGAATVINAAHDDDPVKAVFHATEGRYADALILTASSPRDDIVTQALKMTRKKGRLVIVGDVPVACERGVLYEREIDLKIACSYGPGRYDEQYERYGHDYPYAYVRWTLNRNMKCILQFLADKRLSVDFITENFFSLNQVSQVYEKVANGSLLGGILGCSDYVEVVDQVNEQASNLSVLEGWNLPTIFKAPSTVLRVGVVGAGGFASTMLIPLLKRRDDVQLSAVADTNVVRAVNAAQLCDASLYTNSYTELLADDSIDAVVLATPHSEHTQQLLLALEAGKSVFLEKPLAVNSDDAALCRQLHLLNPQAPWMVDFNRRFSPFIDSLFQVLLTRSTPLVMTYRMNAGFLPTNHWVQSLRNGGRIVGEVCHLVDLALYLTGSSIARVSVATAGAGRNDMLKSDTVTIMLTHEDGSVSNLVYAATGNGAQEKERMELFWDGKSAVLNDYTDLTVHGFALDKARTTRYQQKGHEQALDYFVCSVLSGELSLAAEERLRALEATDITLLAAELARQGGGTLDINVSVAELTAPSDALSHNQSRSEVVVG
jgi:predicted dehydrogenase/threonine dehydrogenase-like Zn-dependent dehydrogenase